MIINEQILKKAKKIIKEKKEKDEYIKLCVKADLCPICGRKLKYYKKSIDGYTEEEGVKCPTEGHFKDYNILDYYQD